jgi:hypothetical protein
MNIVLAPILAIIIGIILWGFAPKELVKVQEAGRLLYFVGILWLVGSHIGGAINIR